MQLDLGKHSLIWICNGGTKYVGNQKTACFENLLLILELLNTRVIQKVRLQDLFKIHKMHVF